MALDTVKLIEKLSKAATMFDEAMAEFSQVERMTSVDSYIMGHVRCCQAGTQSAIDFVNQCAAFKVAKGSDKKAGQKKLPAPQPSTPPDHSKE